MRCTICQKFLPKTARKGTRFCGTNCRSRAYRLRRGYEESSPLLLSVSPNSPQGLPRPSRPRQRAHSPVTIPAVLAHLQQARERAGLPPLQTDPMLAYQASLDALLTEHLAVRRVVATHVTNGESVMRGNASWLQDPNITQVGVGVASTERGDAVVVILLGRSVSAGTAPALRSAGPPAAAHPTPHVGEQQAAPIISSLPSEHLGISRLHKPIMKFYMPIDQVEEQPMERSPLEDVQTPDPDPAPAVIVPANQSKPEI